MDANFKRKLPVLIAILIWVAGTALAAPQLRSEELSSVADDQVVITWVTSNEISSTGIEYGIVLPSSTYITDEGASMKNNHYLVLRDLYPNTYYSYRIFSKNSSNETTYGEYRTLKTLERPSGQYLFSFATLSDLQVGTDEANTYGARGRPYPLTGEMLGAAVNSINSFNPAFTVIKGDLIDDKDPSPEAQANIVISKLNLLASPKYPYPGNHDKDAFVKNGGTASDWYTKLFKLIYPHSTAEAGPTVDSVYNYSFNREGYHFVILDSVRQNLKGHVDTAWLANDLAANTDKKSFVFLHYIITDETQAIPNEVLTEVIGSSTVEMDKIDLDNRADFLTLLSSYEANIASVIMGHIHDNNRYYRNGLDFPFVRTAATVQFPVGFNVYKVYSNGYIQTFYKVPDYTEIARNHLTDQAGYSGYYWQQGCLGSNYDRNFTVTYSSVSVPPTVESTAPAANASGVALNQPIIISFTKPMSTTESENAVNVSPAISGKTYRWSNSDTTLAIDHDNLSASTVYTVSVGTGAKSKDSMAFASPFQFSFTSGTSASGQPPVASIDRISNDITTNPTPTFTGIATDESGSTIANVEFRYASISWSSWYPATPLDGSFNSSIESFTFTLPQVLARGSHEVEVRTTNSAGISATSDFSSYVFYVIGNKPEIIVKANGQTVINGDPINSTPTFEITVITDQTLDQLWFNLDGDRTSILPAAPTHFNQVAYQPTLTAGTHDIKVEAVDIDSLANTRSATYEAANLSVQIGGDAKVIGIPLNFPNPFNAGTETTTLSYYLSRDTNITLSIHDISGTLVAKKDFASGSSGARAGYNEYVWDGKSDSGDVVGNGLYVYLIIADGSVAAKGKLTVLKR
jgi:hypothetical protein